jgi:hypothetical protein
MKSDPVGAIESSKDYAWYIPNIDKRITPSVTIDLTPPRSKSQANAKV